MKTVQIGSIRYSIKLLDKVKPRKKRDICPICKNGLGCEYSFIHAKDWT